MRYSAVEGYVEKARVSNVEVHKGDIVVNSDRVKSCFIWNLGVVSVE